MGGMAAAGDRGALSRLRVGRGRRAAPARRPDGRAVGEFAGTPVLSSRR